MMANQEDKREDLKFFGRVSASVSHDIKNVLAIINEEAGLIQDLCAMAGRGMEVDPERFKQVAGNILGQIKRGDEIVKCMNTFAHSVDQDVRMVEICEVAGLMVKLCTRLANMKSVALSLGNCQSAEINTDMYALQHLLFNAVLASLDHMDGGGKLVLESAKTGQGCELSLSGVQDAALAVNQELEEMAREVNASIQAGQGQTIKITLPRDITA